MYVKIPENILSLWVVGSIPGSGRFPGEGHGNPLQYSCLENPMDRGARNSTVHGVTESYFTEKLCCTRSTGLKFLLLQILAKIWCAKLFKLFCFWCDKIISYSNFNWISLFQMKLSLHEYVIFDFYFYSVDSLF